MAPAPEKTKYKGKYINHQENRITSTQFLEIEKACKSIQKGELDEHFPLHVWQTGSGTQTNMNINEVIANFSNENLGYPRGSKQPIHPNDHVNCSQSSNDTFPTAMHISFVIHIDNKLMPALEQIHHSLKSKVLAFSKIVKIGRTHMQDAVPLTLGQEFSSYLGQIEDIIEDCKQARSSLLKLAIGATAVGTGLNASSQFSDNVTTKIAQITGKEFIASPNKFQALSAHTEAVKFSSCLKNLASSLYKMANDIRLLSSGPRSGFGELVLPKNEPGSSIMPGKVNPTQCEAMCMAALQVIASDQAVSMAASQGHLELNVNKPLIAYNIHHSIHLLVDSITSFCKFCLEGLTANTSIIQKHVENSLMLVTALTPEIGYDQASEIANLAYRKNLSLREAAKELGTIRLDEFDKLVDPKKMI